MDDAQKFDVAFSLLSDDEELAKSLEEQLPDDVRAFLYTSRQRELILAGDGLNAFPAVFRSARICVILHREGWGSTPWTRLEEQTIGDRYMSEGSPFLILLRLDDSEPPSWFPRSDLWVDPSKEGLERTAQYIVDRLSTSDTPSYIRTPSRSFSREVAPIARYQTQRRRNMEVWSPVRPEICDACSSAVVFRPYLIVTLPETEEWPGRVRERLCPPCAKQRGIRVSIPQGMTEEEVYADGNPSFRSYMKRQLSHPILPSLSKDENLGALGVDHVGATITGTTISLEVSLEGEDTMSIPFSIVTLERSDLRSDRELIDHFRNEILVRLSPNGQTE